jgi:hypothetical protein
LSVAIDTALKAVFDADTGAGGVNHATTGATAGFHQSIAPQGTGLPRVEYHELLTTPEYTFRSRVADHSFYQIKALAADTPTGAGPTIAGNLSERMQVLLKDNSLGLGSTTLYCRVERTIPPFPEWDDINHRYIYHKGFICELWLGT